MSKNELQEIWTELSPWNKTLVFLYAVWKLLEQNVKKFLSGSS